jgi:hypothetical protein
LTSPDVKIADKVKQQKKKEKGKDEAADDAQIAWQLQRDLNLSMGRTTRGSGSGRKGAGAAAPGKGAKRGGKVKSKEVIEDSVKRVGVATVVLTRDRRRKGRLRVPMGRPLKGSRKAEGGVSRSL